MLQHAIAQRAHRVLNPIHSARRAEAFAHAAETADVGEQHGDQPPLFSRGRDHLMPAEGAELGAVR